MIFRLPRYGRSLAVRPARLSGERLPGEGKVAYPGGAEHGVVYAVALEAAVAADLQVFMRARTCATRTRTRT